MKQIALDVFANKEAVAALVFCLAAAAGQILHAVKKWADGDAECLLSWFTTGLRATVGAIISNMVGMVVFVQTGVLEPILALPNGGWSLFLFGLMQGFSIDSGLNKGARTAWTAEERTARGK